MLCLFGEISCGITHYYARRRLLWASSPAVSVAGSGSDRIPCFFPCLQAAIKNLGIQESLSPIFGRHPGGARIGESGAIKDNLLILREQRLPNLQN